jgi:F-type H+-transporting ATPase subunit b
VRLRHVALLAFLAVPVQAGAREGGLPQLDPAWFASQIFWLAVHFAALYLVAKHLILPRIAATLDRREGRIAGDLDQADRLNKEAQQAKRDYEAALVGARTEAQKLREQTQAELQAERAKAEHKMAEDAAAKTVAANERIAQASAAMRARMRDVAAEVTQDLVQKVAGVAVDRPAVEAALGRVLDDRLKEVA